MNLADMGWRPCFQQSLTQLSDDSLSPARVVREHKQVYIVLHDGGELTAELSGRFLHRAESRSDLPAVGDWVVIHARIQEKKATIQAVLPRRSSFVRKAVMAGGPKYGEGRIEPQVLAANIDTVFLVTDLVNDFSLRRIERYLSVGFDSGATPVIILNKADLCSEIESMVTTVEKVAVGVEVYAVSAVAGSNLNALQQYLGHGQTAVFLGSSGVGKSTLINSLLDSDRQKTGTVREYDGRGRHTTSRRELIVMPQGGIVIDTPGLREIQMWGEIDGLEKTFKDIESLVTTCRFRNCRHNGEPGCAIEKALRAETLDDSRWQNYLQLKKEQHNLAIRKDKKESRRQAREWDRKIRRHHQGIKELRKHGLL
ncbi:MAG: ribosome small subunit-dependent GTPase A [bacterium]